MSADKPIPNEALEIAERISDAIEGCGCDDCRDKAASIISAALMAAEDRQREKDAKILHKVAEILSDHMVNQLPAELIATLADTIETEANVIAATRNGD